MDYRAHLPGAAVARAAHAAREALGLSTRDAVKSTIDEHKDALARLAKL